MKPKVPGSAKTGLESGSISSPARCGSSACAPRKMKPLAETKKKFLMRAGPSGSASVSLSEIQSGL